MGGSSSWSAFAPVSDRQMSPRPFLAMKFTASGVTFSAAMQKSASLSGSLSSARMTMRPARTSSMAWAMLIRPIA
jgi:hypothetical protein